MSKNAKDKEKPLERFKSLFGLGKASLPAVPRLEEHAIDLEVLQELGKDCPVAQRLKVIRDLTEVVRTRRLAQGGAESLYSLTCDLLHPAHGTEVRHAVLNFYCTLVRAQRDPLDIIRAHCFNLVLDLALPEDLPLRLELVRALTDNGKCLNLFEEQAGAFLVKWMPEVLSAGRAQELLPLLVNVVRFNSSFLDRTTIMGFVQNTCILCCRTNLELDVQLGLELLDSVVGYGMVSAELLGHLVPTACRTVVVAPFSEPSWRLMRNLLGTHLGHRTIGYLCRLLEDRSNVCDTTLLKGAVFFVGAALWSPKAVGSLQHTAAGVLPSLGRALDSGSAHPSVAYEAAVCLQWLLAEGAPPLGPVAWDAILNLLATLLTFPQGQPSGRQLQQMAHELLTRVELSYDQGTFEGSATHLFELVDQAAQLRPETSLLRLVEFRIRQAELCPLRWASQMAELLERFLDPVMATPAVQLRLLDLLASHRHLCQADELVEKVLLPHVSPLEKDPAVAARAVRLLADVLLRDDLSSQNTADLLDVLQKVLMRGWRPEELLALKAAVEGLCHLFQAHVRDGQPTVAVSVLQLLSQHLHQQCLDGSPPADLAPLRLQLVQTLVALRTSPLYQVGLCDPATGQVTFSRQLTCSFREGFPCCSSGSPASVQQLCFREPLDALLCCLREETDGSVLSTLLRGLPGLLRDRAVVLCGRLSLRRLSTWLITHVAGDRKLLDKVRTAGGEALLYPVASALVLYRAELDAQSPLLLLHVLESGLGCKPTAALCLRALALAALELQPATAKILPELLQRLAQLSPTVAVSLPVLEFLACLIRVPQLYASFVAAEYRKVFAIALPYTNPARFSEVVVALAHHLVALWFLKCRVEFRKDLAPFIMKNLRAQLELGEEERRDPAVVKLQEELLATLGDLVAQCSFGSCGAQPRRSGAAMFLLEQGRAQSWLLPGHRLVTITTSGCAGRPARLSLCDRCALFCQEPALVHGAEMSMQQQHQQNPLQQQQQQRRRHQSEAAGRASGLRHLPVTQDDLSLERRGGGGRAGLVLRHVCGCWCCGWAEVLVRRPTGNSAWLLRLQNDLFPRAATSTDFPLPDVAAIFRCHLVDTSDETESHATSASERSPLRRTNSSPEVPAQDLPRCERYDSIPEESQPLRPPADWDSRSHSARRSLEGWSQAAVPPASCYRDRGHTVSGASPASDSGATATTAYVDLYRSGMNPRFVFLHLFRNLGQTERALPLPESDVERSVGVFDHILTYETHRMGLLYVGPGQSGQEQCILSNTHGSVRYTALLRGLGSLVRLSELDPRRTYLGGLACTGEDGTHCLCWQDDVTQVVFHVATLMPNVENDRHRGNKKRHIGNDYVHIVYNESSEPYDLATIRGDCHCVCVVVEPLKLGHNLVSLVGKPEVLELLRPPPEPQLVPDSSLAVYVRQTAIHANVACTNFHRSKAGSSYVNNWHERLQHLERLRLRLVERSSEPQPDDLADL